MALFNYYFSYLMGAMGINKAFALVDGISLILVATITVSMLIGIQINQSVQDTSKYINYIKRVWIAWFCLSCANTLFMYLLSMVDDGVLNFPGFSG